MLKSLNRLDQPTFWMWVIPIALAHLLLSMLAASSMSLGVTSPWGTMDTLVIFVLAMAIAGRFRDIGWPSWIGGLFPVVTMLLLPFAALVYEISAGNAAQHFPESLIAVGQFSLAANSLLIIVAGSVPGRATPSDQTSGDRPDGGLAATQPPAIEQPKPAAVGPLVFAVGGIVAIVLITAAVVGISTVFRAPEVIATRGPTTSRTASPAANPSPPSANPSGNMVLTKETNDFLRNLAKQSPGSVK
jgi:hypothetical protein